ncbi:MAG: AIPR family protein [Flavobacteriaceae bacterium]|nr:AIPR family protein [Flavobacteriaceae bacterium]
MKHIDFELAKYQKEIHHEVNSLAFSAEEGATKEQIFSEHILEILSEAEETNATRICYYERENRWEKIECKINGYAVEEGFDGKAYDGVGYETIDLFITHYKESLEPFHLLKPEFENLIKWPSCFLEDSLKGHLTDEIEESNEAYGLSKLIRNSRKELSRANIFILSNGIIRHNPPKSFTINGFGDLTIIFHVWDIERLLRLSQSKHNREPIEIDFLKDMQVKIPCLQMPLKNDLYECYLAIMKGNVLSNLYHNYGPRLLESNVRAFLQQTGKINRGIRDTILREPEMFLTYNNGLATSAQEVKTEKGENGQLYIIGIKDFQIVNGGQTTASLFYTQKNNKDKVDLSKVLVQLKLTVIKDEDKKNEMVPKIARFANSQNKVSELDLSSNSPFLQRLEELSKITYAQSMDDPNKLTLWFFERVRGQYREELNKCPTKSTKNAFTVKFPRDQIIIKSQVAKFMNIWNLFPYEVSRGSQKNYITFMKGVEKEFSARKKPGRIYWEDLIANAILFKTADKLFGRKNQNPIGDTLIKSYTVTYTLSFLHHLTSNLIDLGLIWKKQIIEEDFQEEIKKGLKYVYRFFESLNVPLVSEAAKRKETWNRLLKTIDNHPFDMRVLGNYSTTAEKKKQRSSLDKDDLLKLKNFDSLEKILSLGTKFWDGLCAWNVRQKFLSESKESISKSISEKYISKKGLTPTEIRRGIDIINYLNDKSIDFESIRDFSRIENDQVIDLSKIYYTLSSITDAEWEEKIELGMITQRLNGNEISTIRAIQTRLKKEGAKEVVIDYGRLQIVYDFLQRLERYKKV